MQVNLLASYRSVDGSGNNIVNPQLNLTTNQDEARIGPANFEPGTTDGLIAGPNPREISDIISSGPQAEATDPTGLSAMMYVWGQFIDHDLDLEQQNSNGTPINITVPEDDTELTPGSVIQLTRAVTDPATGTIINTVDGWLDGSMVYGSDAATATELRNADGTMETSAGDNLPIINGSFMGGDVRATENPDLTAIDTLFVREHNYWVGQLKQEHPHWSGDQLYQMARAIVIAEIQNITYTEFLPKVLGPNAIPAYQQYDSSVDPRITEEFSAGAYRFGHSIVSGTEEKLDNSGNVTQSQSLAQAFFDTPSQVEANGGIDALLAGQISDVSQANDVYAVPELRNLLSASPDEMDLIAIDIQRERDLGLGTLNQTRTALDLRPYTSFSQISSDPTVQAHLKQVYGTADKVDLFIGGLAENHVAGAMVGQTFDAIIAKQFTALRDGDRFWWQNEGFNQSTIKQIENTSLSDIITRNTDIKNAQDDAFVAAQRVSATVTPENPDDPQLVIGGNTNGETITGGPADDTIVAGLGHDQRLTGGGGTDTFVFNAGYGNDTITDFAPQDTVQFTMTAADFRVTATHGHAVAHYDGHTINLLGITPDQLSRSNFILPDSSSRGGGWHFTT